MKQFKISKGIPIPPIESTPHMYGNVRRKYPFAEMKVGDSFEVKIASHNLSAAARSFARRNNLHWKFTVRQFMFYSRIWRIK